MKVKQWIDNEVNKINQIDSSSYSKYLEQKLLELARYIRDEANQLKYPEQATLNIVNQTPSNYQENEIIHMQYGKIRGHNESLEKFIELFKEI